MLRMRRRQRTCTGQVVTRRQPPPHLPPAPATARSKRRWGPGRDSFFLLRRWGMASKVARLARVRGVGSLASFTVRPVAQFACVREGGSFASLLVGSVARFVRVRRVMVVCTSVLSVSAGPSAVIETRWLRKGPRIRFSGHNTAIRAPTAAIPIRLYNSTRGCGNVRCAPW